MPELPEVETVRRSLLPHITGRLIKHVHIYRPSVVAHPTVAEFSTQLVGQRFANTTERRGKYLLLGLANEGWLGVHLRMTGRLVTAKAEDQRATPHLRAKFELDDEQSLEFHDARAFGRLWYVAPQEVLEQVIVTLAKLGPEPEDLTSERLRKAFVRRSIPIKVALLDQTCLAGLGNIYADESLFEAKIHPQTPASALDMNQLETLVIVIQQVLAQAVAAGGTTVRDYVNGQGVKGEFQGQLQVYGRYHKPCLTCGTLLERLRLGGRSSHFCPICQPPPVSL